jgi:hypothetical protein
VPLVELIPVPEPVAHFAEIVAPLNAAPVATVPSNTSGVGVEPIVVPTPELEPVFELVLDPLPAIGELVPSLEPAVKPPIFVAVLPEPEFAVDAGLEPPPPPQADSIIAAIVAAAIFVFIFIPDVKFFRYILEIMMLQCLRQAWKNAHFRSSVGKTRR